METVLNNLRAVLCDPEGKCCISGSDADRAIVDEALAILAARDAQVQAALAEQEPAYWIVEWRGKGSSRTVWRTSRPLTSMKDAETARSNLETGYPSVSSSLEYVIVPLYTHPAPSTPAAQEWAEPVAPAVGKTVTIKQRLDELTEKHGSLRAVARALGCDAGYLSRLASGAKTAPGEGLLHYMGLREVVMYERLDPAPEDCNHPGHDEGWSAAQGCPWCSFSATPPAPAQPATEPSKPAQAEAPSADSTPLLHVGDSRFEGWYADHCNTGWGTQKQLARDAYAAGMGDPLVTYATQPKTFMGEPVTDVQHDLVMLVARMARRLRLNAANSGSSGTVEDKELADQATDYLKRKKLLVTLRDATLPPASAAGEREDDPTAEELEAFRRKHWQHWNAAENLLIAHLVQQLKCAALATKPQAEQPATPTAQTVQDKKGGAA